MPQDSLHEPDVASATPAAAAFEQGSASVYVRVTLPQVARAMSLQDLNRGSRTYGCCDRDFWQYKTVTGFPAAPFQQLALPFALLYVTRFQGNPYCREPALLERADAAVRFWCRAQHRDGAFDEWYRNEHSYCPTAFTTFGAAQTLLLLRDRLADADAVVPHLERAVGWLGERFNPDVMNQNLAACAAMWSVHRLTPAARSRELALRTWQRAREHFEDEGWFYEYGGADLGYTTLALDLLGCLHRDGFPGEVLPIAEKICAFLHSFPGNDLAGGLGSRGTEHTFPFGLEYFAHHFEPAGSLAGRLRVALARGELRTPASVDDRYLAYFYLPHFVLACTLPLSDALVEKPPVAQQAWPQSGFCIWRRTRAQHRDRETAAEVAVVCSLRRQGAFSLSGPDRRLHRNLGYWVETAAGQRWSSSRWTAGALDAEPLADESGWRVRGAFTRVADELPLTKRAVPFHILCDYVLRWPRLAEAVQRWIKRRNITSQQTVPLNFERTLRWDGDALEVTDLIRKQPGCPQLRAVRLVADVEVHSPSARLEPPRPLRRIIVSQSDATRWATELNQCEQLRLRVRYAPGADGSLLPGAVEPVREPSREPSDAAPASEPPPRASTSLWRFGPRLLGPVLFVWVLTRVDLTQVWASLRELSLGSILAATAMCVGLVLVKGLRWHLLLRVLGFPEPAGVSLLVYGDATFWGTLTPGRLGEFKKLLHLRRWHAISWARGFWFSVVDRLFDLAGLVILFGIGLLGLPADTRAALRPEVWAVIAASGVLIVLGRRTVADRASGWLDPKANRLLRAVAASLRDVAALSLGTVVKLTLISMVSLSLYVGMVWVLAFALPFELTILQTAICVVGTMLAGLLPISLFNFGTREVVLIGLLGLFGLTSEDAISLGMLFVLCYLILIVVSLPFYRAAARGVYGRSPSDRAESAPVPVGDRPRAKGVQQGS